MTQPERLEQGATTPLTARPDGAPGDESASPAAYTGAQRRYIALSLGILILIMVGVAFAAGVYIGNHREIAAIAEPAGPPGRPGAQQAPQRFGQPQRGVGDAQEPQLVPGQAGQPGAFAAGGASEGFDLTGTVTVRDGTKLELATATGPVTLELGGDVRFEDRAGRTLPASSMREDDLVGLVLRPGTLKPLLVVLLNGRPR